MQKITDLKVLLNNATCINGMVNLFGDMASIYEKSGLYFFVVGVEYSKSFKSYESLTDCLYKHGFRF